MQPDLENASDIPDESRFQDLLLAWLESRERGAELALEGLVSPHDSPALLTKLQQWTADLREFDSRFGLDLDDALVGSATSPAPPPRSVWCATQFSDLRHHAAGGRGEVFKARDIELRRSVALKFIKEGRPSEKDVQRFLYEARVTGYLDHPGVVSIHAIGEADDGRPCYAMRFIQGEPLARVIGRFHESDAPGIASKSRVEGWRELLRQITGRRGSVPDADLRNRVVREVLGRFRSACEIVAYAHSRGVLHCDLKPSNIMLSPFDETLVVDWGLARRFVTKEGSDDESHEFHGGIEGWIYPGEWGEGTPDYMSPEQIEGVGTRLRPASDIYNLGATLYELLTSRRPFEGRPLDIAVRGSFPRPRQRKRSVPRALEEICLKALSFRPEDRYATADALADDLGLWLAGEPVSAWKEPLWIRFGRWLGRHRKSLAIGVPTGLVVVAILVWMSWRLDGERRVSRERAGLALQAMGQYVEAVEEDAFLRQSPQEVGALRRKLLNTPLEFYLRLQNDLATNRDTDPVIRAQLAEANSKLGLITTLIGSKTDAERAYRQSYDVARALVANRPRDPLARTALSHACLGLGKLLSETGRMGEAFPLLEQGTELSSQLAKISPPENTRQREFIRACSDLAVMYRDAGQPTRAENRFRQALELLRSRVDRSPDDAEAQGELARVENNFASLLAGFGHSQEALALVIQARDRGESLSEKAPSVPRHREQLGRAYMSLGLLRSQLHGKEDGRADLEKSVEILKDLVKKYPLFTQFQADLAAAYGNTGNFQRSKREYGRAQVAYLEAEGILKHLVEDFPTEVAFRNDYANFLDGLMTLRANERKPKEARDASKRSIEIRTNLVRAGNVQPLIRRQLAASEFNLGLLDRNDKRMNDALADFQESRRLLTELTRDFPDDLLSHSLLGRVLDLIGITLLELDDPKRRDDALSAIREAGEHHNTAIAGAPDVVDVKTGRDSHDSIVSQTRGLAP
jgi:serine/threonine protein kinase